MNRAGAWAVVASLAAGTVACLAAPPWAAGLLALLAIGAMRKGRLGLAAFALVALPLNALLMAAAMPTGPSWSLGPLAFGLDGALVGLQGGTRLVALLGVNLALLSWFPAVRLLDALGLPRRATAIAAALLIGAHDVARDLRRIVDAARLEGTWPKSLHRRALAAASLLPPLLVVSLRRASVRRDALQLAGHRTGPAFVPVVAVSALAVAGRLALLAAPNVALTYVVVFLGGMLFGWRVGAAAGAVSMLVTNLLLTGLLPEVFANVPAMAAVGALGGLAREVDFVGGRRSDRAAGRILAALAGLAGTFLFSVLADAATWAVIPDYRGSLEALGVLVAAGLAFNAVPAIVNAILFAAAVAPVQRAFRALAGAGVDRAAQAPPSPTASPS